MDDGDDTDGSNKTVNMFISENNETEIRNIQRKQPKPTFFEIIPTA